MSAYVVDPRTVDYLVAWATRHRHDHGYIRTEPIPGTVADLPDALQPFAERVTWATLPSFVLYVSRCGASDLGALLMRENVRSVTHRYPDDSADDLPGPIDQRRVWRYTFRPVDADALRPDWVIMSCRCLDYQSCETSDWRETLAYHVLQAIREDAIDAISDGAPWGVTDDDLHKLAGASAGHPDA